MTLKQNKIPPLYGLVLTGGRSKRMGTRKEKIKWRDTEQCYYAAALLEPHCNQVYISYRDVHVIDAKDSQYPFLADDFLNMGPLGGILTAFRNNRNAEWLVMACDLPLIDSQIIQYLVSNRDPNQMATAYQSQKNKLIEPLITIWEPASFKTLLLNLSEGITCPRKALNNEHTHVLAPLDTDSLMNVNTPEEARLARYLLSQKTKNDVPKS